MKKIFITVTLTVLATAAKAQTIFQTGIVTAKQNKYQVVLKKENSKEYVSVRNINSQLYNARLKAPSVVISNPEIIGLKVDKNQINEIIKESLGPGLFQELLKNPKNFIDIDFRFGQDGLIKEVFFFFPSNLAITPQMIENIETRLKEKLKARFDERTIPNFNGPVYKTMSYIPFYYSLDSHSLEVK
ncbi:hypothetical protein MUY27_00665 [Mucilaginibacter sp. RS28]|uniref:Uncharacterized protein n=1 Tax=Mucilaginibacter straminoryzae TaxID=2932774 RepID=A0A9X1WYW5_9SPHI|nr:hypothetical protein [Mucilaginibacter straminoryzae]MCJ8208197.1 hypothetical protein [Mucilaginibacter straminoryzae]